MSTFSKKDILIVIFISVIYILFSALFINFRLLQNTVFGYYSLNYKITILFSLVVGIFTSQSTISLILLFILALLTAINLVLVFKKIAILRRMKQLRLVTGGGILLGIAGSGCSVCGLSLISLLGLGGGVAGFPFLGYGIQYAGILLLLISIFFLTKNNNEDSKKCRRVNPSRRRVRST